MSEQRLMPEVLPGDLITRVGLYEARCGEIVPITGWEDGWWITEWDGVRSWYASNGRQRFYEGPDADRWQLLHWVGPLPATEPEPETTSEQLAEIEGQAEQPPQPQPIQVREGLWRQADGGAVAVRPTSDSPDNAWKRDRGYVWSDGARLYLDNGRHSEHKTTEYDLVEYLGPIQRQSEPQPEPQPQLEALKTELTQVAEDRYALQQRTEWQKGRIEFLETLNACNGAAINGYKTQIAKLLGSVDTARDQLEAAATERDELRAAIDAADKQLDQKDAQIRDLRIELDAAQQVPQPVSDEERERIWDEATEQAGRQVVRWLRPLTLALHKQPDERFCRFMALTLSVLPDVLPELLGYAVEDESDCEE